MASSMIVPMPDRQAFMEQPCWTGIQRQANNLVGRDTWQAVESLVIPTVLIPPDPMKMLQYRTPTAN